MALVSDIDQLDQAQENSQNIHQVTLLLSAGCQAALCFSRSRIPGYIGVCRKLNYVEYGPILARTGVKKSRRQMEYRQFMEEGLADTDADFLAALKGSRRSIGGEDFLLRAKAIVFHEGRIGGSWPTIKE